MTAKTWIARSGTLAALALSIVAANHAWAAKGDAEATYRDIEKTLGVVPEFFREFPQSAVGPAWEQMKGLQLNPRTSLSPKAKELIGLAVAAQIPCSYCVYFHTETAKANGATEEEIKHALAEAAVTRQWSTIITGAGLDEAEFRSEMKRVAEAVKKQPKRANGAPVLVTDAKGALADIEKTYGFVPTYLKRMPQEGLAGAWNELKMVEGNAKAPLEPKTISLIGLAVASQIPCTYCVIADTEMSNLNGATDKQKMEAVAVAGIVRHWSTFLNGAQIDEQQFKTDVDAIIANMKKPKDRPVGR